MEIQYLNELQNNPIKFGKLINSSIVPISEEEIKLLETNYNNGKQFPKALRELLFLAGNDCYVLDYGLDDSQQELQEFVRGRIREKNRVITRPFYAIDVYNALDQFLFVYLDEGDNPAVHEGHYWDSKDRPNWITLVDSSLSQYIEALIERVKNGQNPF
ncbi:hypothetical protein [Empedobacter falsenii]|uniref:hypothetical protein n=1 Tax=Empedobacter falsenii TaxID=343874 RepID=UPI0005702FBE|nr:hypothetical protein [Empedobacter falsenii]